MLTDMINQSNNNQQMLVILSPTLSLPLWISIPYLVFFFIWNIFRKLLSFSSFLYSCHHHHLTLLIWKCITKIWQKLPPTLPPMNFCESIENCLTLHAPHSFSALKMPLLFCFIYYLNVAVSKKEKKTSGYGFCFLECWSNLLQISILTLRQYPPPPPFFKKKNVFLCWFMLSIQGNFKIRHLMTKVIDTSTI